MKYTLHLPPPSDPQRPASITFEVTVTLENAIGFWATHTANGRSTDRLEQICADDVARTAAGWREASNGGRPASSALVEAFIDRHPGTAAGRKPVYIV